MAAGETAFRKCQNKLGPDKAGTVEGYAYSDADKNSGIVWSEASFKEYLGEPARKDARDKGDPIRQEREGARGLVGLSQAVWSQREEEKSVTDLAST